MATVSPPLPPPPPPPSTNQPLRSRPTPIPGFAAIPFFPKVSPPVQETNPSSGTHHEAQEHAPATPQPLMENEPQFPPSQRQEDHSSDGEGKKSPVQETEPAPPTPDGPQETELGDEAASQMRQAGEDLLP